MCDVSECLQIALQMETECFKALGRAVCDLPQCAVAQFIAASGISPHSEDRSDIYVIKHALHWVCPQSNLNPNLSRELQTQISNGLRASLNR